MSSSCKMPACAIPVNVHQYVHEVCSGKRYQISFRLLKSSKIHHISFRLLKSSKIHHFILNSFYQQTWQCPWPNALMSDHLNLSNFLNISKLIIPFIQHTKKSNGGMTSTSLVLYSQHEDGLLIYLRVHIIRMKCRCFRDDNPFWHVWQIFFSRDITLFYECDTCCAEIKSSSGQLATYARVSDCGISCAWKHDLFWTSFDGDCMLIFWSIKDFIYTIWHILSRRLTKE